MKKKNLILMDNRFDNVNVSYAAMLLRALAYDADFEMVDIYPAYRRDTTPERDVLADFLKRRGGEYEHVFIIDVPFLPGKAAEDALARLKGKGVVVEWVANRTGRRFGDEAGRLHEKGLLNFITGDGWDFKFEEAVSTRFGVDLSGMLMLDFIFDNMYCGTGEGFMELADMARWFRECYGKEEFFPIVLDAMARKLKEQEWGKRLADAMAHYRRHKRRELAGSSAPMQELREKIRRIAEFPKARVMILGESGTGKETVAMQIHYSSPRSGKNFVTFNCATVEPNLLESRFFGYEKGAFTGADRQTKGLFEAADGGTLFLDEIGELDAKAQGMLLRVLEEGCIKRVGGTEDIPVDVRIISATNRNLPEMVSEGSFRSDLYQRLCVVQVRIPPLREHLSDIKDILQVWSKNNAEFGKEYPMPSDEQIAALMDYDYPGNVRELINIRERAEIMGTLDFAKLMHEHKEMNAGLSARIERTPNHLQDNIEAAMRLHVRRVCEKYGGNVTRAAEALGMSRNTVRKYL